MNQMIAPQNPDFYKMCAQRESAYPCVQSLSILSLVPSKPINVLLPSTYDRNREKFRCRSIEPNINRTLSNSDANMGPLETI